MSNKKSTEKITILFGGMPQNSTRWLKNKLFDIVKNILVGKQKKMVKGGPEIVQINLIAGLQRLGYKTLVSPPGFLISSWVGVLSDLVYALPWALQAKKKGRISYLVAGPNLVVSPDDHEKILLSPEIDKIVVPSQWVKDYYSSVAPSIHNRIHIWPVGIDTVRLRPVKEQKRNIILVYQKNAPQEILNSVLEKLKHASQEYKILVYGQYSHEDYLKLLSMAKALILLSQSESQGIAMFEAWSYDVPVLAWDRGYWVGACSNGTRRWDGASSAPYLTNQSGMRFTSKQDFPMVFQAFIENIDLFSPREYVLQNFTLEICAQRYLDLFPTSSN